jgi:hypothetical protein
MAHRILHYYWISAKDETGKPYLIKGGADEASARARGFEMLQGADFEIKDYPTTNIQTARGYFCGKRLAETHSLRKSVQRIGHEKSIKRNRNRF